MKNQANRSNELTWHSVCTIDEIPVNAGCCALVEDRQIALFHLPAFEPSVFAVQNYDPFGHANVLSRGIVGDLNGAVVVASPMYKQHFDLRSGECLEDPDVQLDVFPVRIDGSTVLVGT